MVQGKIVSAIMSDSKREMVGHLKKGAQAFELLRLYLQIICHEFTDYKKLLSVWCLSDQ